mmetsp:Transcript_10113/g.9064  ORF Transcript_10113/g.9064 Transcript_10113/m.9064 type:complete len:145 (+) Transcript_10113:48-482(+)
MNSLVILLILTALLNILAFNNIKINNRCISIKLTENNNESDLKKKSIFTLTKLVDAVQVIVNNPSSGEKLSKDKIENVLKAAFETIKHQTLENENDIRIKEFGTFKIKKTPAREGRNPKTGEGMQISARTTIAFSPSDSIVIRE